MSGIMRLGFVEVQVDDLRQAANFYNDVLGLQETQKEDDRIHFKCWDEYDHHSVVLRKGNGPGLVKIGWKAENEQDLDELEKKIEEYGITVKRVSRREETAMGQALSFTAPSGQNMMVYSEMQQVRRTVTPPEIFPAERIGIGPPRLDHVVLGAEDVDESVRFLTSVFGFRISEQVLDPSGQSHASFLFRTNTPHDIAIVPGPNGKFHHFAFYLDEWNDVRRAAEILAQRQLRVEVPPSQHGITRGCTTYFRDPANNRIETFAGGYITYPDFPTITWSTEQMERGMFNFGGPSNLERFLEWI